MNINNLSNKELINLFKEIKKELEKRGLKKSCKYKEMYFKLKEELKGGLRE